jgi:hypothetical protein
VIKYTLAQQFLRVEAIGNYGAAQRELRGGARDVPADPCALNLRLVRAADDTVIDDITMGSTDRLYRINTGTWAYRLPLLLLQPGYKYIANFRFEMIPGALNVLRQEFTWQPVPQVPHESGNAIIYGLIEDTLGLPVANGELLVETYKDLATLNERTSQSTVRTDAFGLWWLEAPQGAKLRFVFGDISKVVEVPAQAQVALGEIAAYQPAGAQRDKFGYPFPGDETNLQNRLY